MKKNNLMKFGLKMAAAVMVITAVAGFGAQTAKADSKIRDLEGSTTHEIDLDEDGEKEEIFFELSAGKDDYYSYQVTINGETHIIEKKIYDAYEPHIQVADIDVTDGHMDMWIYCMGTSEDVAYSALYQYWDGEMKELYTMEPTEFDEHFYLGSGILHKTKGDGIFYIRADRAFFVDALIGNHYDLIPMQLKDGEVSFVETNTYSIAGIYNENNQITVAVETDFYKKPKADAKVKFTAKRWDKVKPVKIRRSGTTLYVKFKNEKGQAGWLCANDFDFGDAPFLDLVWVD